MTNDARPVASTPETPLGMAACTKEGEEITPTGIEAQVCKDIARRQHFGLAKYGKTVADNPLTHKQWLEHAYFEALDMAIYLRRAMRELEDKL